MKNCFCGKTTREDAKKEGFSCCKAAGFIVEVGHEMLREIVGGTCDNIERQINPPMNGDKNRDNTGIVGSQMGPYQTDK